MAVWKEIHEDFSLLHLILYHFLFPLQSKLSKLSQAPKLEPLNEGGGAALLQVVSVLSDIIIEHGK